MRARMLLLTTCILAIAAAVAVANAQVVQTFSVTNTDMSAYIVDGVPNKPLTLVRGKTYAFNLTIMGNHPFDIKTVAGAGTGNRYSGFSPQAQVTGTLMFPVPANAPASLFYQCEVHPAMVGAITIVDPVPTPATGPVAIALLCAAVLGAGYFMMRRRAQVA